MFKVIKFNRYTAALALMLVAALAVGLTVAVCTPRSVPVSAARPRTLVIDPGHGGIDGGAVSADGIKESDINLAVALRLNALAELFGTETYMTRTDDAPRTDAQSYSEHADLVRRVEEINSVPGGVLISIHQNCYPTSQPSGAQVLYSAYPGSEDFGRLCHANLIACLDPQNRRVAEPASKGLYITANASCPAILAECGFMSNPGDVEKLNSAEYQTALAAVLLASYLQYVSGYKI